MNAWAWDLDMDVLLYVSQKVELGEETRVGGGWEG